MRKLLKIVGVLLLIALAGGGVYVYRIMPKIPARPFVKPGGPNAVGTREYDWIDTSRAEAYTRDPNDRRHVLVQIWYPAVSAPGDTIHYLLRPDEFASRMGAWVAKKARTNATLAPELAADSVFPVLVYNHGGLWTRWSATFAAEWMASHGYVVVSVEHYGFNQTVKYADGTPFKADTLLFPKGTGDGVKDAQQFWAYLDDPVFKFWEADARFALDQMERLNRDPGPFRGRLDLTRVGAFGWSFGGALSVQLSKDDPRIVAAVDHDGQLFGDVRQGGTSRPVLQFHHGKDDALDYPEKERASVRTMMAEVDAADSTARLASTADWYSLTIAGTDHGNFSDIALFVKPPRGATDPRRAHEIINTYTLAFFDQYIRGRPSNLFGDSASPYPEVTFRAWRR